MGTTRIPALAQGRSTPTPAPLRSTGFAATARPQSAQARELAATAAELGHRFSSLSVGAPVQAKLAVSEPGDRHEREADAVAEQLAGARAPAASPTPMPAPLPVPTITPVPEQPAAERAREEPIVEREAEPTDKAAAPPSSPSAPPPDGGGAPGDDGADDEAAASALEAQLARPRSAGHALPATTRAFFEAGLGFDFGHVRLHTDVDAARLNAQLGAVAFTHGADIYFSPGSYDASSHEGRKLLAHELTHVVQQHGGKSTPPVGRVHRSIISGEAAGKKMQEALLTANPDLIVEAPIPGGTREGGKDKTKLGWADLYTSSDTGNVIWVRGRGNATGGIDYEPVVPTKKTKTAKGKAGHNPTFVSAHKPFKGDFPSTFKVADIKQVWAGPSFLSKLGEGLYQVDAYKDGLPEFADQAIQDGKASVRPSGSYYDDLVVPPGIDYSKFDDEIQNAAPSAQAVILGDRRVWMHPAKKNGLYLVFDLPHPYKQTDYRTALEAAWKPLEPVRKKLTVKQQAGGKIDQKRKTSRPQRRRAVQRKVDWAAAGKAWEGERKDWDTKYAKPFLASNDAKVLGGKYKIDSELGLLSKGFTSSAYSEMYHQVGLWSGLSGKFLGELRFKLGPLFDKVIEFIDWARGKLQGFLEKVRGLKESGSGWVRTVVKVLIEGVKIAFRETVSLLFDMYRDCLNGIMSMIISEFAERLSEELIAWLQKTHDGFVQWVVNVYKEFEDTYKKYQDLIDTVLDIANIVNEVSSYEKYIRIALEAFACLDPPGFGCLWGLVAQFAIGDIIELAVDTDFFHDRVIKPLARKLLKGFLDEPFKKLINKTMDAVGLGDWAQKVSACHPDPKEIDIERVVQAMPAGISVTSPEFKKKKAEWNQKMMNKYMPELQQKFSREGKEATVEDILRLIDSMNKKRPKPEKLKDALDKSTGSDGKIDIDGARFRIDPPPILGPLPGDEDDPFSIRKRLSDEPSKGPKIEGTEKGPALKIPF